MHPTPELPTQCTLTGIQHHWTVPGGLAQEPPAPSAVFFLNGIGLDLEGFRDPMRALEQAPLQYPYRNGYHVALTVPGFEDWDESTPGSPLSMAEQARRVAAFMDRFLVEHPAREVILYGFSYGSDLAVEVLACLETRVPLVRVVLTEMNVHLQSCFITSRIAAAYAAARGQDLSRHREAYKGFVSRVVKANAEGRLSASLMQDMALYFRTIARKNWTQLAHSAEEASDSPEIRVARLLGITANASARFDLVFSDPEDLRIVQRRLQTWGGDLGRIRIFDATAHEHFHHMSRAGVMENLGGWLREAGPDSSHSL